MLNLIVAELKEAVECWRWDDLRGYAYHTSKAGGIAAATGASGLFAPALCDEISSAYEFDKNEDYLELHGDELDYEPLDYPGVVYDEYDDIINMLEQCLDSGQEVEPYDSAPKIGWTEYGAALNEAVGAKDADDGLRYALMMGFVSGLMFNNPGPTFPEYGTILDAIDTAYTTGSDDALKYAQALIAAGVRMTDPTPFMGEERYNRYMSEKLETLRWVRNFGLHHARASDEAIAVPNSMAINHAVRQMNAQEQVENPPRPIEMCYWVVPGKLLAGEYPRTLYEASSQEKLRQLTDAGVSAFIDLTQPDEPTRGGKAMKPYDYLLDGPSYQRFAITDGWEPASSELTKAALDAIDAHIAAGETVYVHCWGGVGRTGTIIGCWLARHYEPGPAALDLLQELWRENPKSKWRRRTPETPEQEQYVLGWDKVIDALAGSGTDREKIAAYHRITNTFIGEYDFDGFNALPRQVKVWYRDDRIESESAVSFADLPQEVQDWYRQVATAQHKADQTGDYSELIALGAWPAEDGDEPGE